MCASESQELFLADGSKIVIRTIDSGDASMLQAFVRRLSSRSRRMRFFSALVELSAAQLQRMIDVDQRRGLALVALAARSDHTAIIAEARCVVEGEDRAAEFAIAVADEFQRRGIGTELMNKLLAYASRRGVSRLFGQILAENHPMLAFARRLGFRIRTSVSDGTTITASISPSTL